MQSTATRGHTYPK